MRRQTLGTYMTSIELTSKSVMLVTLDYYRLSFLFPFPLQNIDIFMHLPLLAGLEILLSFFSDDIIYCQCTNRFLPIR